MLVLRAPGWELLLGDATRLDAKLSGFQRIAKLWYLVRPSPGPGEFSGDPVACAHHRANVTYNVFRGGLPLDQALGQQVA